MITLLAICDPPSTGERISWIIGGAIATGLYCLAIWAALRGVDDQVKRNLVVLLVVCAGIGVAALAVGSHSDSAAAGLWVGLLAVTVLGLVVGLLWRAMWPSVVVAVSGALTVPLWGLSLLGLVLGLSGSCFD